MPKCAERLPFAADKTPKAAGTFRVAEVHTLTEQEQERGFLFPGQSHPMLELTYVERGKLCFVCEGRRLPVAAGEMILCSPGSWWMYYAETDEAPRFLTAELRTDGEAIQKIAGRTIAPNAAEKMIAEELLSECRRQDPYADSMRLSLLTQLLIRLLRRFRNADLPHISGENEIICRAQQFVALHSGEKLTVPYVAECIGVSPSYLTALFHKHLQISPAEYIRRLKLQLSKDMIRQGNQNFTEIAAALQYSTVHHFSRQFKENFGITPTQYAKSVRYAPQKGDLQ